LSIEQQFSDACAAITKQPAKVDGNAFAITQGRLILFAQLINDSKPSGNRLHVATYHAGECCAFENNTVANLLLTFGTDPETQVLALSLDAFAKLNTGTSPFSTEFYNNIQESCIATNLEFDSQIDARTSMEHAGAESLIKNLAEVINMSEPDTLNMTETGEIATIRKVATHFGIVLPEHLVIDEHSFITPIDQVSFQGKFRTRKIRLINDWRKMDSGAIFTYTKDGSPVALVRKKKAYYATIFSKESTPKEIELTSEIANNLQSDGWTFYRTFPTRVLKLRDILAFALRGCSWDLVTILLITIVLSLVNLLAPYVTGELVSNIIPQANHNQLLILTLMLLAAAFSQAMLGAATSFANMRIEAKAGYSTLAAFLDRVLTLPAPFFRSFSSGDLAQRIMGIETIRSALTSATLTPILHAIYSISYFGMIFYYSSTLALWAVCFVVLLVVLMFITSIIQIHYERQIQESSGKLDGLLQQLFTSIEKIRVASAENRMFSRWALLFQHQRIAQFKSIFTGNILTTFNAGISAISTLVVYYVYVNHVLTNDPESGAVSTGAFLAFSAAFAGVLNSGVALGGAITPLLTISPIYKRLKPMMEMLPEETKQGEMREILGHVAAKGLSFRYEGVERLTLDNVSIDAAPGEFIAIVGPSGSGKSTLLKMLLGMEKAIEGDIFFDDVALGSLDTRFVRRQIGTVMQDTRIMSTSIMQMLLGTSTLTIDDAWNAAKIVGIDKDIEAMPMQMFTVVQDGTVSGGQKQRMMIARALIHKPKILFLDEATSALDQISQKHVTDSINALNCTRIVIAHRLSTIIEADKIYVLVDGKITEQGSYDELMANGGEFAELAKRQLTS
jgi:NHLM bacteriocin system ABC transporter ATP-binding protein